MIKKLNNTEEPYTDWLAKGILDATSLTLDFDGSFAKIEPLIELQAMSRLWMLRSEIQKTLQDLYGDVWADHEITDCPQHDLVTRLINLDPGTIMKITDG